MFSNKVSLVGVTGVFQSTTEAAKEIVAEGGKGKQCTVDDKKDQSDNDIIEIVERPDPEKVKQHIRKLIGASFPYLLL